MSVFEHRRHDVARPRPHSNKRDRDAPGPAANELHDGRSVVVREAPPAPPAQDAAGHVDDDHCRLNDFIGLEPRLPLRLLAEQVDLLPWPHAEAMLWIRVHA